MIDFASIKKTPCGRACHYFGIRIGLEGSKLHCFAVWTEYGVFEWCYNDAGQHLSLRGGKWVADSMYEPIAPPPKRKVWAYYKRDSGSEYGTIWLSEKSPEQEVEFDDCDEVEVP